jgi:hypothetical protein
MALMDSAGEVAGQGEADLCCMPEAPAAPLHVARLGKHFLVASWGWHGHY